MGLTTLPPSRVDCLKIWQRQPCCNLGVCPRLYKDDFTFTFISLYNGFSSLKKLAYVVLKIKLTGCANFSNLFLE